jgi:protein farnesyltransferase subunit beta
MRAQLHHKRTRPKAIFIRKYPSEKASNSNGNGNSNSKSNGNSNSKSKSKMATTARAGNTQSAAYDIPDLFRTLPSVVDPLETNSSVVQRDTIEECLPFLLGEEDLGPRNAHGIPLLDKQRHLKFLRKQLGPLPGAFMAADPSRPWFFYWCLAAMTLLGEDVAFYREKLVETVRPMQNATGGFAGGQGQMSHLATTYATVLSLALVGGSAAYEVVDRKSMWNWLGSLKQPDGGFQMAIGGEEDVR